jgi:DNA-binding XRE family transcriptional regulator
MRHTDTFEVTIKGMGRRSQTFVLPQERNVELKKLLHTMQGLGEEFIPAEKVFPELFDPVKGPATSLRGLRYREKLTQKKLADMVGILQHHLSEMENGKRPIGKAMAKKLAEVLNGNWRTLM